MNSSNPNTYSFKNKFIIGSIDEGLLSLREMLGSDHSYSLAEFVQGYCNDIEELLQIEDSQILASSILKLAEYTEELSERFDFENLPNMNLFFQKLSPLLLSSLALGIPEETDVQEIHHHWLESLRIALEEELYHWKNS